MQQAMEGIRAGELSCIMAGEGVGKSNWVKFYEGRLGPDYQAYVTKRYKPFIDAIVSRSRESDHILELGAGTGTITKALVGRLSANERFTASDVDLEILSDVLWRRLVGAGTQLRYIDARQPRSHDANVVHSHGMLEHFDDETIRQIIRAHSQARVQVHYVPGLYDAPTFGDECLMSAEAWWRICEPVGLSQVITFNGGLDYAMVFE